MSRVLRFNRCVSALALLMAALPQAAQAQGLLEALFGARPAPVSAPAAMPGTAPGVRITVFPNRPDGLPGGADERTSQGVYAAYCVRTCDGRFFPLPASGSEGHAERCQSLCPAADVRVYYGTSIDSAATREGRSYTALPNAFRYRDELVASCTCNGTSQLGLAKVSIDNDPTLRVGDIVAEHDRFKVVTRERSARRAPLFRPLAQSRVKNYGISTAALR